MARIFFQITRKLIVNEIILTLKLAKNIFEIKNHSNIKLIFLFFSHLFENYSLIKIKN
jgi:hypothetical protein